MEYRLRKVYGYQYSLLKEKDSIRGQIVLASMQLRSVEEVKAAVKYGVIRYE